MASFGYVPALAVWAAERIAAGGAEVVQRDARVAGEADGRPNLVGSYHYRVLPKRGDYLSTIRVLKTK